MSSGLQFDESPVRSIEALYQTDDAAHRGRAVLEALDLQKGGLVR